MFIFYSVPLELDVIRYNNSVFVNGSIHKHTEILPTLESDWNLAWKPRGIIVLKLLYGECLEMLEISVYTAHSIVDSIIFCCIPFNNHKKNRYKSTIERVTCK